MANILYGEPIARVLLGRVKKAAQGKNLKLVVVQIGANKISASYILKKEQACKEAGIIFCLEQLPNRVTQEQAELFVKKLGQDPKTTGIIVQLPLPSHLATQKIIDEIPIAKDVDVLSSIAFGKFALSELSILPPTIYAIKEMLEYYNISVQKYRVALVGAGRLLGIPAVLWLLQQKATVLVAHSHTRDIKQLTMQADLIISGVGKPRLITGNMVKQGAVVIDAGTVAQNGKIIGDIDKSVFARASQISPVPGGVGPVTVACLLSNLIKLALLR